MSMISPRSTAGCPDEPVYAVCPEQPHAHLFRVEIRIPAPQAGMLRFALPAWIPGSYTIRDFARHVVQLDVLDADDRPLSVTKEDKQTWTCAATAGPLRIRYRVYAWELSVRAAHLDRTHAYFNGAALLMRIDGWETCPCRLELQPPPLAEAEGWRVATSLAGHVLDPRGFGTYRAEHYPDLIDHPVEMGHFAQRCFQVEFAGRPVPHQLVLSGRQTADTERIVQDLARICTEHAHLFGALPLDRYWFLVTLVGDGHGGLEHRFSTSLICSRTDLLPVDPSAAEPQAREGYWRFLGLCSHEYFHLWHVTRIRPAVFMRQGLEREVHTRTLWAFEGITSYYDDLALVRSGLLAPADYLGLLAGTVTRLMRTPGRQRQTLADSSFDAWTKFYKQDENAPNAIVSYYTKGAVVALALDLLIRRETAGRRSLDHIMRALWERHGRTGEGVGERAIETLASELSGLDLRPFFAQALDSTAEIDLVPLLASVGVGLRLRPSRGAKDSGGCVERFAPVAARASLEVRLQAAQEAARIQHVIAGGAGEQAGLAPGDLVIAVAGLKVDARGLEAAIARATPGEPLDLHLFRGDVLMRLQAFPRPAADDTCELTLLAEATAGQQAAREDWLASAAVRDLGSR